jgi:putative ABC transport system substrate-binding protein
MRRREFIGLVGGAAAWPMLSRAQETERMRRVGALIGGAETDPEFQARVAAFRQNLEKLGWSEGKNIRIDYRFTAASRERTESFAKELVALQPEVIFASSTLPAAALHRESRTIPIVFGIVGDPIGLGFVVSLSRPGGNMTGFTSSEPSISGKWLGMLKEVAPHVSRAAFIANPATMSYDQMLRAAQIVAPSLEIELVPIRVATAADIEREVQAFGVENNGGLVVPSDLTMAVHRDVIVSLAARHRLPAVYGERAMVVAGGLLSYSTDLVDLYRQSALYVDRILRGAKPPELPVQAPTKYTTVLNLKTAKSLGLTVPPGLLVAADEVIE